MRVLEQPKTHARESGFTLLELVIVIAILAIIGGAALVNYDGLDKKAALSQSAFNLAAIDKGIRLNHALSGSYPNELDSLVHHDTSIGSAVSTTPITATSGGFVSILTSQLEGVDANQATTDGLLHFYSLSAEAANALNETGMTTVRGIPTASDTPGNITLANRAFDSAPNGQGTMVNLATGLVLPIVKSKNLGATHSNELQQITGLDADTTHIVIALGLGNNSSIVSDVVGVNSAAFSEAPFYGGLSRTEYGRFLLLFHLASDLDSNDTISSSEIFRTARFVGAIDALGNWRDKAASDAVGNKS